MLYAVAGTGVDAPRLARDPAVHQLTARLALRFRSAGGSHPQCTWEQQQPPWKVVRAFPGDAGRSLVHLHNVSGGVLSGDHLSLDIHAGPGSVVQVTTTGATRGFYRHRAGSRGIRAARQDSRGGRSLARISAGCAAAVCGVTPSSVHFNFACRSRNVSMLGGAGTRPPGDGRNVRVRQFVHSNRTALAFAPAAD